MNGLLVLIFFDPTKFAHRRIRIRASSYFETSANIKAQSIVASRGDFPTPQKQTTEDEKSCRTMWQGIITIQYGGFSFSCERNRLRLKIKSDSIVHICFEENIFETISIIFNCNARKSPPVQNRPRSQRSTINFLIFFLQHLEISS
jgi:hypothetical protein